MVRQCDVCSVEYLAKRRNSRFCSDRCRKRAQRGAATVTSQANVVEVAPEEPSPLVATVISESEAAGQLNSSLDQQAVLLAGRIGAPFDTGSSVAALSKELRAVMAKALEGAQLGAGPLVQLRARRLSKLGLMPRSSAMTAPGNSLSAARSVMTPMLPCRACNA
jgi:hypothetical protein